jgi:hypothetical protein
MHTVSSFKAKKNHIVLSYNNKNFKKYILACILILITRLLKSGEFGFNNHISYFHIISKEKIAFR